MICSRSRWFLVVGELPFELVIDRVAQLTFVLKVSDLSQDFWSQFGKLQPFDIQNGEFEVDLLAPQIFRFSIGADLRLALFGVFRLGSDHQLVEVFQRTVQKTQVGADPDCLLSGFRHQVASMLTLNVYRHKVIFFSGAIVGDQIPVPAEQILEMLVDIFLGEFFSPASQYSAPSTWEGRTPAALRA